MPSPSTHRRAMSAFAAWCVARRPDPRLAALGPLRVEDDEVVLPEPLEKLAPLLFADGLTRAIQDLGDGALAVDRRKELLLSRVDEERKIGIGVARIDEHGGDAARRAILDGQRPGKPERDETPPGVAVECDGLGFAFTIVAVGDEAVPVHRSAQEFDRRMLGGRWKRCKTSAMGRALDRAALRKVAPLLVPGAEPEPATLEPIVNLRHGIGPILRVQQGVGERVGSRKVLCPLHNASDRMVHWQRLNRLAEIAPILIRAAGNSPASW